MHRKRLTTDIQPDQDIERDKQNQIKDVRVLIQQRMLRVARQPWRARIAIHEENTEHLIAWFKFLLFSLADIALMTVVGGHHMTVVGGKVCAGFIWIMSQPFSNLHYLSFSFRGSS